MRCHPFDISQQGLCDNQAHKEEGNRVCMADRWCGGQDTSHAVGTRLTDQDTQGTDEEAHGPENTVDG